MCSFPLLTTRSEYFSPVWHFCTHPSRSFTTEVRPPSPPPSIPGYSWTFSSALTHGDQVSRIKEDLDKEPTANELIGRVFQLLTLRERPVHMKVQPSRESDGRAKGSGGSPLFARIIGREQELEFALSSCRGRAEDRIRDARKRPTRSGRSGLKRLAKRPAGSWRRRRKRPARKPTGSKSRPPPPPRPSSGWVAADGMSSCRVSSLSSFQRRAVGVCHDYQNVPAPHLRADASP